MNVREPAFFHHFLGTGGADAGTTNLAADFSTPDDAYVEADALWHIHSVIVSLMDGKGFEAEEFGNLGVALTNGLQFILERDLETGPTEFDFTFIKAIKSNHDFEMYFGPVGRSNWTNTTKESIAIQWNSGESGGTPIVLRKGERFILRLADNLSGLDQLYVSVQGHSYGEMI